MCSLHSHSPESQQDHSSNLCPFAQGSQHPVNQKRNESHLNSACCLFTKLPLNRLCTRSLQAGSVPLLSDGRSHSSSAVPSARCALSDPCFSPDRNGHSQTSALKLGLLKGSQTETLCPQPPMYSSLLCLPKNSPLEGTEAFRACSFPFSPLLKRLPHP